MLRVRILYTFEQLKKLLRLPKKELRGRLNADSLLEALRYDDTRAAAWLVLGKLAGGPAESRKRKREMESTATLNRELDRVGLPRITKSRLRASLRALSRRRTAGT
jgi:hypothetical protein